MPFEQDVNSVFRRAVEQYGGTIDIARFASPEREGIQQVLSMFRGTLESLSIDGIPLRLRENTQVGVVDNVELNAVLLQVEGTNCIGIFVGTLLHVYRVFMGLLSSPRFLPEIGCSAEEDLSDEQLGRLLAGEITDWHVPKDPVRRDASLNFGFHACMFIFLHELTHVARGHLALLAMRHGLAEHLEYADHSVPHDEVFLLRVLELDADGFASIMSMTKWQLAVTRGMFPSVGELRPEWTWACSTNVLFRILDQRSLQTPAPTSRTHPGPGVRWVATVLNLLGPSPGPPKFQKDGFSELTIRADREIRTLWREVSLPNPGFESMYRSMSEAQEELSGYIEEIRALDSALTALARDQMSSDTPPDR